MTLIFFLNSGIFIFISSNSICHPERSRRISSLLYIKRVDASTSLSMTDSNRVKNPRHPRLKNENLRVLRSEKPKIVAKL